MSTRYEIEIKATNKEGGENIQYLELEATSAATPREAANAVKAILKAAPTAGSGTIHAVSDGE